MLSASLLSALIETSMRSSGAKGPNLKRFCDAIATGIVESIVGATFTSADIGSVPADMTGGSGSGIGIVGLSSDAMQVMALSLMTSRGPNAPKLMKSIMDSVAAHLLLATLVSSDSAVFSGTGTVTIGSIAVDATAMSNNIIAQFSSQGAIGPNFPNLSTAIGTAVASNIILLGTGSLSITGSPGGPSGPGSGTGSGTIS